MKGADSSTHCPLSVGRRMTSRGHDYLMAALAVHVLSASNRVRIVNQPRTMNLLPFIYPQTRISTHLSRTLHQDGMRSSPATNSHLDLPVPVSPRCDRTHTSPLRACENHGSPHLETMSRTPEKRGERYGYFNVQVRSRPSPRYRS